VVLAEGPTRFDSHISAVDEPGFAQTLVERRHQMHGVIGRSGTEIADHRHRRLLRMPRKRPSHRATEQRDELAPPDHSITSAAVASSVGGTSRPSALAVLRLMAVSNLVGACTGKSAGFSPLRIRLTYDAACRNWSRKSVPYEIRPPAETNMRSQ